MAEEKTKKDQTTDQKPEEKTQGKPAVPTTSEEVSGSRPESVGKEPKVEVKSEIPAEKIVQVKSEEQKPAQNVPESKPEKSNLQEKSAEKLAPSGKYKDLIKQIEELSVLELSELVKELEDRFGVSASMPMAVATAPVAGADSGAAGADEKAIYTVHLAASGEQKINVIKAVREITGLGLKDAKDLADAAPKDIKTDVPKEEAEEMKKKLEEAGATVELK